MIDPKSGEVYVISDRFGYHPVFTYRADDVERCIVASFPDAIAGDPAASVSRDEVSVAEFLSAWRVTPPNTYYREIKHIGAATRGTWNLRTGSFERSEYWRPYETEHYRNIEEAAEELAAAVSAAVRIRTLDRLAPVVSFTSGGMDSRAVLFSAARPANVVGLNLYDVENREAAIAKRLCDAAGCRYVGFARDDDYYPRWLPEGVRVSGGMWSAEDNHFIGMRELVRGLGARTVITACTTDWLFKGYGLEQRYLRLFGRNLPLKTLTSQRVDGFLPNVPRPVPAAYAHEVTARREEWFAGTPVHLTEDRDWLLVEDRRIRPACYTVSVSGQVMYRAFPYDTFLADIRVSDCYSRMRAEWKINSEVWGRVVRSLAKRGGEIEDANFGWRVGAGRTAKLARFAAGWIGRRIPGRRRTPTDGLSTDGSWPNLAWYLDHSSSLREQWETTSHETRSLVSAAWGANPWDRDCREWAPQPNDFFRLLTVARHLDGTRAATRP
ncbi:MAG: asparagine synthase-related protein [Thermoanaerobaculia bacterium]